MQTIHLVVLGFLLFGVLILALLGFFKYQEGFQADIIRCPPGYTFFNGPNGDSMCCRGTVDSYNHTCSPAEAKNDICSLSANIPDPRLKFKGETLRDCKTFITTLLQEQSATTCPMRLPHFAKEDEDNEKCCKNPVQLYGETGYTCTSEDLKNPENYCIAKGIPTKKDEKLCTEAKLLDTATCPKDLAGRQVFQTVQYTMGAREVNKYDIGSLAGLTIPTCYRLNETCIPENVIRYSQSRGAFTDYDPATWEYSCAVWEKKNRGEAVSGIVKGYP